MVLKVSQSTSPLIEESDNPEMVERKGKGHPDSVCDECAEAISRALSQYYLEHFGRVYHHNVDKFALIGGVAKPTFGGGEIIELQRLLAIGRATDLVMIDGKLQYVPIGTIVNTTVRGVIKKTFRNLDPDTQCIIDHVLRPGSLDLVGVFDAAEEIPLANDTSFGVGFAPYSDAEKITLETELLLNSDDFKDKCSASGEDIKVMTQRIGKDVNVTVCNAMVAKYCEDRDAYINARAMVKDAVEDLAAKLIPNKNVTIAVNTGDLDDKDIFFLTITGTSAENGDDGVVGRGNRASGLITPTNGRPQTLEAAAGKNPINHVGKIYSVMSNEIAKNIVEATGGDAAEVYVRLLSQIGHPINEPWLGDIEIKPAPGVDFERLEEIAISTAQATLNDWMGIRKKILGGEARIW
ncbi:MAG TPA: methionine adenosyltransferase [Candidatus Lokiarchaeia archaeon]|nr:methionine adenosyltransferase [Candidatus Lokiarchaeia archaeon]